MAPEALHAEPAGRCATGGCSTTARPTRRPGSSCCSPRSATRALIGELERRVARGRRVARAGARSAAAGWCATARASGPAGSPSRAGATPSLRSTATPRARGIVRPDGSTPPPPLADTDVQAVAYAALRALARADRRGGLGRRAEALGERLGHDFGPGVMALEGDDLAVPGPGSQLGWLLWCGRAVGRRRARRSPRASASRTCSPPTGCARSRTPARRSTRRPITAAASGRSTTGSAGAGCGAAGRADGRRARALRRAGRARRARASRRSSTRSRAAGELAHAPAANRVQAWTVGARWAFENDWGGRPAFLDQ